MKPREITVTIDSLNEKGFGVGQYEGRVVECLGSLPGETVVAKVYKKKRNTWVADTIDVIKPSPSRVVPRDTAYASSSPYQILDFQTELDFKHTFISELFAELLADWPKITFQPLKYRPQGEWNYRNKVEFSFYAGENNQISLAFHKRGSSKGKIPITGTAIAEEVINQSAQKLILIMNKLALSAFDFKTVIVRYSRYTNSTNCVLYCKVEPDNDPTEIYKNLAEELKDSFDGAIHVVYSQKLSPASIVTEKIYSQGNWDIEEEVAGCILKYPVDSFFQINVSTFELIIEDLRTFVTQNISDAKSMKLLDLYAGVGTLGIVLGDLFAGVEGVELFDSYEYAVANASQNKVTNYEFLVASSSAVVDQFVDKDCIIVDPPRSGMELKVLEGIIASKCDYFIYVSCNPVTQARDLKYFKDSFNPVFACGYNLYPKTPHMESLMILKRKVQT